MVCGGTTSALPLTAVGVNHSLRGENGRWSRDVLRGSHTPQTSAGHSLLNLTPVKLSVDLPSQN